MGKLIKRKKALYLQALLTLVLLATFGAALLLSSHAAAPVPASDIIANIKEPTSMTRLKYSGVENGLVNHIGKSYTLLEQKPASAVVPGYADANTRHAPLEYMINAQCDIGGGKCLKFEGYAVP